MLHTLPCCLAALLPRCLAASHRSFICLVPRGSSTLREAKAVDQRTHRLAQALLRSVKRFPRSHHGKGRGKQKTSVDAKVRSRVWTLRPTATRRISSPTQISE